MFNSITALSEPAPDGADPPGQRFADSTRLRQPVGIDPPAGNVTSVLRMHGAVGVPVPDRDPGRDAEPPAPPGDRAPGAPAGSTGSSPVPASARSMAYAKQSGRANDAWNASGQHPGDAGDHPTYPKLVILD